MLNTRCPVLAQNNSQGQQHEKSRQVEKPLFPARARRIHVPISIPSDADHYAAPPCASRGAKVSFFPAIMAKHGMCPIRFNPRLSTCSLYSMKRTVAIVEDEPAIRDNYAAAFTREGYVVRTYSNRSQAMSSFASRLPDLAVIDISLEDEPEGGFELCRQLRALSPELPIIFLTARDSELDAVSGLRLGADDFLTKDLSLAHLIARVNALFRRVDALRRPAEATEIIRRGPLTLNAERMQVEWDGHVVLLSLTEFWIVYALSRHCGHVKNRQQLMDAANVVLDDNTITSHIKRIRRKFQSIDPEFDALQTVYGMGYRWVD